MYLFIYLFCILFIYQLIYLFIYYVDASSPTSYEKSWTNPKEIKFKSGFSEACNRWLMWEKRAVITRNLTWRLCAVSLRITLWLHHTNTKWYKRLLCKNRSLSDVNNWSTKTKPVQLLSFCISTLVYDVFCFVRIVGSKVWTPPIIMRFAALCHTWLARIYDSTYNILACIHSHRLIKGLIFLKNRHFFIQERFDKLIYGINTIIKYGIWQPVKFQLVSRFWSGLKMKYFFILSLN